MLLYNVTKPGFRFVYDDLANRSQHVMVVVGYAVDPINTHSSRHLWQGQVQNSYQTAPVNRKRSKPSQGLSAGPPNTCDFVPLTDFASVSRAETTENITQPSQNFVGFMEFYWHIKTALTFN